MPTAEQRFALAMKGTSFNGRAPTAPAALPKVRPPDPPGIILGELDTIGAIAIDLVRLLEGRLLIQGVSGAGKSWLLRRLCEQANGIVQEIVIDPEGEFRTLAETLKILYVTAHEFDPAALRTLAARVREHRTSLVLDLSELDRSGQMIALTAFLEALVHAPNEHWHPCLVAIDEAHLFAPFGGYSTADTSVRKAAIGAVVDLMSLGRKRGLAGVLATQRLARLAKSVSSEVHNHLIGQNTQDLDIRRAAEQIGWDARKGFDRLPLLEPGEFIAVGRAFSSQPAQLKVGGVTSEHKGASPPLRPVPAVAADDAQKLLGLEQLREQSAEDAEMRSLDDRLPVGSRAVRELLRNPAFAAMARLHAELLAIAPAGATLKSLAQHLGLDLPEVGAAVALLDSYGIVEFGQDKGQGRPVAIDRNFLKNG